MVAEKVECQVFFGTFSLPTMSWAQAKNKIYER